MSDTDLDRLAIRPPVEPMLATARAQLPKQDDPPSWMYEPKWDGFRCLVFRSGAAVHLGSRGGKDLLRYFPELAEALAAQLPDRIVLDGEIVVRTGEPGAQHLDWDALSARIHPAASRVAKLARQTPSSFVAFDLLAAGDLDLTARPFGERRAALARELAGVGDPLFVTAGTTDAGLARDWFVRFEGAGLDGVLAKRLDQPYQPGKRTMVKVKHSRTTDVVLFGYRPHTSGQGVGSLLLGLYDDQGRLVPMGGASSFTAARRRELEQELAPHVRRGPDGRPVRAEGEKNRFNARKDNSFVVLEPDLVAEVAFDQLSGSRFRHAARFVRWRPDREPGSCLLEQVVRPAAYDLGKVLEATA